MQRYISTQNKLPFVFRKWSRTKYGAFKSLGKQVAIATMVLAFSFVFEVKTTQAQADTADISKTYEMDEVVITGERTPVLYSRLARLVTVLDKEEIESAPVQDITGLLEYVLILDIRQRSQPIRSHPNGFWKCALHLQERRLYNTSGRLLSQAPGPF